MKQRIYLSLCLLSIECLAGCGNPAEVVTEITTPTPAPIVSPSPIASVSPTPQLKPAIQTTPASATIPFSRPIAIAPVPKPIYPAPVPVAILVPSTPKPVVKTKAILKAEPVAKLNPIINPAQQITPVSIGVARIGMSFKDLKQQMGEGVEFPVRTSLIDGFDAIAVTRSGTVQYYIPYPTGTTFTNEDRIQHLMTDNPNYRTDRGIGPGTTIRQAASVYGNATLSLSKENESREFINFTQHPTGIAFRPKPAVNQSVAGDYPESNDEYLNTQKYDPKAAIGQITVSCSDNNCGKESN